MLKHTLRWLPAVGWYGWISWLSSVPANESLEMSQRLLFRILDFLSLWGIEISYQFGSLIVRKSAHMILYFIFALLIEYALSSKVAPFKKRGIVILKIIVVLASLDEFHQTFIEGRSGNVIDVLIDCAGAIAALYFLYLVKYRKQSSNMI